MFLMLLIFSNGMVYYFIITYGLINTLYVLGGIPEVSYSYIINEESTFGVDILISTKDDLEPFFALTPHYRFYFGKKRAAGFFAETFAMLNVTEGVVYDVYEIFSPDNYVIPEPDRETDVALGISIGGKFVTSKNFIFEIYGGVGRNLFNDRSLEFIPRLGISFGKRF